jgi:4-carboxymuconolactone decarboxylase
MQVNEISDRMPPIAAEQLDPAQRAAAAELIAGPRKAVTGPFVVLLRSPELMQRVQKLGEYLRFETALSPAISEFATLIVARRWTQQFEWLTHVPLALREGVKPETIDALREGRRPESLGAEEAIVYDFASELLEHHGVCDATFKACQNRLGDRGIVELVGLLGYFVLISMVLNVAHAPAPTVDGVEPLTRLPR